ncbi:hypothetical protein MBAV_003366 [Candidatus Magnetobacterium bavaricum]|uniref:Uncharacterized protein n=1 Tax=Candidatus Magnetobacterium bavaricum TaxID=29290 RepID=A0A0F3GR60_9BACT|nr:hypothetical protein MBAV_003366 [Candidatus Magnetobacterium bavaricum]
MYLYCSAGQECSSLKDTDKYPLLGHDALPCLVKYFAFTVALLADLCDLCLYGAPKSHQRANGERLELESFGGDIFGKITACNIKPCILHLPDALYGQHTDLPVPLVRGVGVSFNAIVLDQIGPFYRLLPLALIFARVNRDNLTCLVYHSK